MAKIEESIDVRAPLGTVYNQWTQFESFPQFMEGVVDVRQLDETHLRWKARVGGRDEEWVAEITEQRPDERIAWRSTQGAQHGGVVTFHRLDSETTRIMLQLETEPATTVEKLGDAIGVPSRQVSKDLERFRDFIESRGLETGAWRGEVDRPES